jgi:G:T-mismatch repair DNA endonuclease (very short patch repair protein)
MNDVFGPEARSYIGRIKKTDTKPEIKFRKF